MLELGQPNHPYDLAKVRGGGLRVRRARAGETLVTLDGVERTFTADDLLICDGDDRPVGIAGVMGGADTEIDASTTDVLLEMAWFLPISASPRRRGGCGCAPRRRPGSRRAPIPRSSTSPTGASPSCWPAAAPASRRARSTSAASCPTGAPVRVRTGRVNRLLGTELGAGEIAELLEPIGFATDRAWATTPT